MKNKGEIIKKFDEVIQYFINLPENLPGNEFCSNVNKLIDIKCDLVNGVDSSQGRALHKHIVSNNEAVSEVKCCRCSEEYRKDACDKAHAFCPHCEYFK